MWLREILRRRSSRRADAAGRPTATLLEELAADGEDFADVAAVLGLDPRTVLATLVAERPRDATALLSALTVRATPVGETAADDAVDTARARGGNPSPSSWASWGGRGWGRWTRVRGGTRVHHETTAKATRPALVVP